MSTGCSASSPPWRNWSRRASRWHPKPCSAAEPPGSPSALHAARAGWWTATWSAPGTATPSPVASARPAGSTSRYPKEREPIRWRSRRTAPVRWGVPPSRGPTRTAPPRACRPLPGAGTGCLPRPVRLGAPPGRRRWRTAARTAASRATGTAPPLTGVGLGRPAGWLVRVARQGASTRRGVRSRGAWSLPSRGRGVGVPSGVVLGRRARARALAQVDRAPALRGRGAAVLPEADTGCRVGGRVWVARVAVPVRWEARWAATRTRATAGPGLRRPRGRRSSPGAVVPWSVRSWGVRMAGASGPRTAARAQVLSCRRARPPGRGLAPVSRPSTPHLPRRTAVRRRSWSTFAVRANWSRRSGT